MTPLLLALLLAAPGTVRVRVEGGATEVVALSKGEVHARAPVKDGEALLRDLSGAAYDLRAYGPGVATDVEHGVRPVQDGAAGFDAVLAARPAHRVTVKTEPGATVWSDGVPYEPDAVLLPAGLHRFVVDHPERVSSAERLLRVAGPMEVAVPLDPGLRVTGRIVGTDGKPVAGAAVEAFADGFPTKRRARTDADGAFFVGGVRGDVVSLHVRAPGHADTLHRLLFFPGEERTRVTIALGPGATVRLETNVEAERVLLPEWYELALEERRLKANFAPRRQHGTRLLFDGLTPGRRYRVLAAAPGHRPGSTESFVAKASGMELPRLELSKAASIAGRTDAPVGAVVVCQGAEGLLKCRTDRLRRFRFDSLDPGEHILWVRHIDETGQRVQLAPGRAQEMVLKCREPGEERSFAGHVWDADDKPLAGAVVAAAGRRAVTDAEGGFVLAGLAPGRRRFTVQFTPGPDCRALAKDPHLPHVERKVGLGTDVKVKLQRAGRLWIRFDPGDRVLARARLHLAAGAADLRLRRTLPYRAKEVVIDDLPVGPYVAEVAAPGVAGTGGAGVQVVPAPTEATVVRIAPGRTARGQVFLRRGARQPGKAPVVGGAPLKEGHVTLLSGDSLHALATVPVEQDGSFVLEGLPAAPVLLLASAPGLPVTALLVDLTRSDADGLRLVVMHGVEAAVRVTGDGDDPLPDARVVVTNDQGVNIRHIAARGRFRGVVADERDLVRIGDFFRLTRTPSGRIAAPFLQPGSYRFHVAADGYKPLRVGVRARTAWAAAEIRERFPETPADLASPVRLVRAPEPEPAGKD